jgi:probable metal-binding protein
MTSPASYHGHDVLHFLLETEQALSREEILTQVTERFGANARFHTCSAEGMDVEALGDWCFSWRGKSQSSGGTAGLAKARGGDVRRGGRGGSPWVVRQRGLRR